MRAPTDYELRVSGAQMLLLDWLGQPFKWGDRDCARLAHAALEARGRPSKLPAAERYTSAAGSLRAIRRLGYRTLVEVLDAHGLDRIAPAAALPLDIVALPNPADDGMPALTVFLGLGRVLGFHDDVQRAVVIQPRAYLTAWRT